MDEGGGRPMPRGVGRSAAAGAAEGQDLVAESESRKRKAAFMSRDSGNLVGNGEYLEGDPQKLLKEIEDLRSRLDDDVKELGYCEANQKLRIELALKAEEVQCLRKQNEEMQAKYDGMMKLNGELQAKNGGLAKQTEKLQANGDGLIKRIEKLEAKNNGQRKQIEELQAKNDGLTKQIEDMQAKYAKWKEQLEAMNDSLMNQNKERHAKNYSLMKQNEKLQAKSDGLTKWNEELGAKNDSRKKWNKELQAKNVDLHKNGLKDGLTGCTDIGTKISRDIIPESVQRLMQAEPTLGQAASSFEEIGHPQAQVTKLETVVTQLMANNRTLAETKASLNDLVVLSDDEDSETDNNLVAHLVTEVSNIGSEDLELNTRICDLMVTGHKSKSVSKKRKEHKRVNDSQHVYP